MTARLPIVGGDNNDWGTILNNFLEVAHNADGTLNTSAVSSALPSPIPPANLGSGTPSSGQALIASSSGAASWSTLPSAPVSTVFGRAGAVVAASGDYTAAEVTNAADKSSSTTQSFTGDVSAPAVVASGLTGATAASRYAGASASGYPTSGTFNVGDFVIDQTANVWICTTAGSPGSWTAASLQGSPGIVWQGTYSNSDTYGVNDVVYYSGSAYICILGATGESPANTTYWELLAGYGPSGAVNFLDTLGTGSDGAVTLDGSTTYTGFANRSGSTYTLTRDVQTSSLTINSGVTLKTNGARVLCQGTITNNGSITYNGNSGTSSSGASATNGLNSAYLGSAAGKAGETGVGTAATVAGLGFGSGGAGGAGSAGAGGAAGTANTNNSLATNNIFPYASLVFHGVFVIAGTIACIGGPAGGGGGAGGGGDGTNAGGGGGATGGAILIFAEYLVNNGTISANGGNGYTPTTGNAGGGGGGAGGFVGIYTISAVTGSGTVTANGGSGGSGVGTGAAGSAGANGSVVQGIIV